MKATLHNVLFLLSTLIFPHFSAANVLSISSLADNGPGSLREGISLAQDGDTLEMSLPGTILLDSQLVITKDLYIRGFGADTSVLDVQGQDRHFFINDTSRLELSGFTLQNGDFSAWLVNSPRPGGGFPNGGSIKLLGSFKGQNLVFAYNRATFGGAISITNSNPGMTLVELEEVSFIYNRAAASDGNFGNFREIGGAIYQYGLEGGGTRLQAKNCTFSHNEALYAGGGVYTIGEITGGTEADFTHCTFAYNQSDRGAGFTNDRFSAVFFDRCLFGKNEGRTDQDVRGSVLSRGYNLLEILGPNTQWNEDADSTDLLGFESGMADLAFLGSLPTHPLECSSPAIDGVALPANNLPTDQRGQARIGLPDIGAHERNAQQDGRAYSLADRGAGSLRLAIELACPGDTISLAQLSGSIRLASSLLIDKDIFIFGNPNARISLNGGDSIRIVDIEGVRCDLRWLNFQNGNPQNYGGGAIRNSGKLSIFYCAFFDNQAVSGGAIANYGQDPGTGLTDVSALISNSTFSRNKALVLDGGAIDNRSIDLDASLELISCTIAGNHAANNGGGISSVDARAVLRNSIVANNSASEEGKDLRANGLRFANFISAGSNLVGDSLGSGIIYDNGFGGDIYGADPRLDPLGNYEGPTLSMRLQEGSPAIDAGQYSPAGGPQETDQRGFDRVFGGQVDIGAYESNPATAKQPHASRNLLHSYPNPVSDVWYLELGADFPLKRSSLQLFDVNGLEVKSVPLQEGLNKIGLDGLQNGLYLWKVEGFTGKIILH